MHDRGADRSSAPDRDRLTFLVGFVLAAGVGFAAFRAHALTAGGAIAACAVGTATFGALGLPGAAVLLAFFVSSVALSRVGKARKRALVDVGKLGPRDAAQVLANGGIAALCAIAATALRAPALAAAFAGAFGAATADTWGTEIGTLVRQSPRSILTLRRIPAGLSGGVTAAGSLAEIAGAGFIALVAFAAGVRAPAAIAAGGIAGALVDSILGASLQALRSCSQCERSCETNPHVCGSATQQIRGVSWIGNDFVNAAATLAGASVAWLLAA